MSEHFLAEEVAVPQAPKNRPLKLPFPRDCPIDLDLNPELAPTHPYTPLHAKRIPSLPKYSVLKFLSGKAQAARTHKE